MWHRWQTFPDRRFTLYSCSVVCALLLSIGCSAELPEHTAPVVRGAMPESNADETVIQVPANRAWTDTGFEVHAGQTVTVTATGRVVACRPGRFESDVVGEVGPEGTYLFSNDVCDREFPLPAAGGGPAPCYCLLARVGDGAPQIIAGGRSWTVDSSGPLRLGINDFDVTDNSGSFTATINTGGLPRPVSHERVHQSSLDDGGRPAPGSVVVIYVDGLRPDVVREMSALGHLPNIRRHFLDGGAWLQNAFTAFPSDTITSNGTMWTGCFSDRHGLKCQVRFSRRRLVSESYLDPFGPHRSAQVLAPRGVDQLVQQTQAATIGLFQGADAREEWLEAQRSSVPPLYEHLQAHGMDWAVGVLPVMTEVPPPLWSRSMARFLPYFQAHRAWEYMDEANSDYAVKTLLQRREAVTIIWLPETDTCSHKCSRGQFGMTRRTIARADALLGAIVDELRAQGRLDSTYLILVSDHGHLGGRETHLTNFDLANEFFFEPRLVDSDGNWVGGGLGLSVRMHRLHNRHPGDSSKEFVFIDGDSDGAARIFFPRGHYRSRDWSGPNRPGDLLNYRLDDQRPPIDLPMSLASIRAVHGSHTIAPPIDLVLMKLTDRSILITTSDRGQAVIERRPGTTTRWDYRYQVVTNVRPQGRGGVAFDPVPAPTTDPLGLTRLYTPSQLNAFHDERQWLELTARTQYPDAVVTLTRHMLWDEGLGSREQEYAPDLVVTARPEWYFGTDASPGTMHGYPLPASTHASWFVSGPHIRRGTRIEAPCRLADLTPTILDMTGLWDDDRRTVRSPLRSAGTRGGREQFDGRPVRAIYAKPVEYIAALQPVQWEDVDLDAWGRLQYQPLAHSNLLPRTIHNPQRFADINNLAYDVATIGDWSVFRMLDDVVAPVAGSRRYVTQSIERTESFFRRRPKEWVSRGARVPDVPGLVLSDYSFTSQGNLVRVDRAIDWVQNRGQSLDSRLASPLNRESLPLTGPVNQSVDALQSGFWETYRYGQRTIMQLVDEGLLNHIENGTDRMLNAFDTVPAEIILDESQEPGISRLP